MSSAKMTLIGLYDYDNTIFNDMVMPEGIDKDLFIQSLLMRGGEFEVLYPQPVFMKYSVKIWSSKWFRTFAEWLRGTKQTWNPIFNYDRYETTRDNSVREFNSLTKADYNDNRKVDLDDTRTADLQEKRTADLQDKRTADLKDQRTADLEDKRVADLRDVRTDDLQDKRTADLNEKTLFDNADTTTQTDQMTTEHQVAAYDSSSYVPSSKDIVNNGQSKIDHTGSVNNATTGTDTNEHTGTEINDHTGTDTTKHTGLDIMEHSGTDTTKHTGTDTTEQTGTDTTKHTGTDNLNRKGTLSDNSGNETNEDLHEAHMYGNIGVTSSSSMLKEFYDIASWNLYEHMCDVFISELLIPVY